MIKHVGKKWLLYTANGSRILGEHATEAEAKAQEAAIEAAKAKRGDAGLRVQRWDRAGELINLGKDESGILRAMARPAKVGVYPYLDLDGSVHYEFTPPETLFDAAFERSMALVPLTLTHPPELVTADNARRYAVGTTGEIVTRDGDFLTCAIAVTDRKAVDAIDQGIRELSCGYTCELDWTQGQWQGQRYDCVQHHRIGNHLAIVEKGRHGPQARIALDAASIDADLAVEIEDEMPATKKFRVDDSDYDISDDFHAALTAHHEKMQKAMDSFGKKLEAATKESDKAKDAVEKAVVAKDAALKIVTERDAEIATLKPQIDAARKAGADEARARLALEAQAALVLGDAKFEGKTDDELRRATIAKIKPALSLDGRKAEAIAALFDVVIADVEIAARAATKRANDALSSSGFRSIPLGTLDSDPVRHIAAQMRF